MTDIIIQGIHGPVSYTHLNCVACTMEGTRPILSEIQALVTKTGFGTPRRAASGFDFNRMRCV